MMTLAVVPRVGGASDDAAAGDAEMVRDDVDERFLAFGLEGRRGVSTRAEFPECKPLQLRKFSEGPFESSRHENIRLASVPKLEFGTMSGLRA